MAAQVGLGAQSLRYHKYSYRDFQPVSYHTKPNIQIMGSPAFELVRTPIENIPAEYFYGCPGRGG